jgi:hypothetical protein
MRNIIFILGIFFISMGDNLLTTTSIPRSVRFVLTDTIHNMPGSKILSSPGTDSLWGYKGSMFFPGSASPGLEFLPSFSTPMTWSADGKFLLAGISRYNLQNKQTIYADWRSFLTADLPEKNNAVYTHWRIHNAQWHPSMRFLIVFSGYAGPWEELPTKLKQNFPYLHQLVMADSTGKNIKLLAEFNDYSGIDDMQLSDTLLVTAGKDINWWDLDDPGKKNKLNIETEKGSRIYLHPSMKLAAVTSKNGRLVIWDTDAPAGAQVVQAHEGNIRDAVFHPGLALLFTEGDDNKIKCWWWENGKLTQLDQNLPPEKNYSIAGFDAGNRLVLNVFSETKNSKQRYALSLE